MPQRRANTYLPIYNPSPCPARCTALENNGSECGQVLQAQHHDFCSQHHFEKKRLYKQYKEAEAEFKAQGDPTIKRSIDAMEGIVQTGEKVVALRDEVNRRFFSKGTEDNRSHIKHILKIKDQVDSLKILIASEKGRPTKNVAEGTSSTTVTGGTEGKTVLYRNPLSPEVPMSELNHLPRESPIIALRIAMDAMRANLIDRIYQIFPSLNDSASLIHDREQGTERQPNKRDLVIRNVFREFLVWTEDTDVLARASKTETIDTFLRHSTKELDSYIKFLEAVKSSRHDTSHFLRDAICDYLLPQDVPSITILGGRVALDSRHRKMGVDGWDILYQLFSHEDTRLFLEQYSMRYDDLLLVKKLSALYRYGKEDEATSWLHPEEDVAQECPMALFLGFVAQTRSYHEPNTPFAHTADGAAIESRSRNYLTGRMSKNDPLAKQLIDELASRVVAFSFYAYDRETGEIVAQNEDMDSNWITRTRTACSEDQLVDATWKVEWSLRDILNHLNYLRSYRDRMMGRDYYELIIIERLSRPRFGLLHSVAGALVQLSGDPSPQEIFVKVIRDIVPSAEQDESLNSLLDQTIPDISLSTTFPRIEYEGSRLRAWDVRRNCPDILENSNDGSSLDAREANLLSKILSSMEAAGVVSKAAKYERPQATPMLLTAMDGHEDVYFDYSALSGGEQDYTAILGKLTADDASNILCNSTLSLDGDGLRCFARDFKAANPNAVFTKGMIHPHYCAWPYPHKSDISMLANLNFCTPDGHLYKWKHLPFDLPMSFELWQFFLHCEINCKLPFVRATQTTFVICAATAAEAETNMAKFLAVAEKLGWKLSFPMAHRWTSELGSLDIEVLWRGIQPLAVNKMNPSSSSFFWSD
ncbi:hypothetical protein BGZ63DRAFT_357610 [Mariannaea sp. PMI_226]|nr:hypothetical protein BGZ63DRAFT_357610 [Mariannaea sp. PMI_226]